jgi:glycosyltransferase involved in cell wall biosynthesis
MACGAAVACSNTSAVPEVADGAALVFNPYNSDEIARTMLDLIVHTELHARMCRLGLQRATRFSWQNTARETLEVYYSVVEERQIRSRMVVPASISRH